MEADYPVHCSYSKLVNPEELKPHPRNPNKHPEAQIELLAKLIKHHGWRAPITVSKRSGLVIRGHARLDAALFGELKAVPVDEQDYDSQESELADLVADNKIAELSVLEEGKLVGILSDLEELEFNLELAAYTPLDLETLRGEGSSGTGAGSLTTDIQGIMVEEAPRLILLFKEEEEKEAFVKQLGFNPEKGRVVYDMATLEKPE